MRRWHETEGLPVHKHLHQQRGAVWAYKSELDMWLERRRVVPDAAGDGPEDSGAEPGRRPHLSRSFVAFVSNKTGEPGLWVAKTDGSSVRRLPEHSNIVSTPGWSPDGKFLVYGTGVRACRPTLSIQF